jgi:uncharacterized membrane-anchored protein
VASFPGLGERVTHRFAQGGDVLLGDRHSQTLGTALGDWIADDKSGLGLGYEGGAVVFGIALAIVAAAYFWTRVSHVLLFWAAFILTRPLGATVGDFLDKPHANGGRELSRLSRYWASAVLAVFIFACITLLPQRAEKRLRARI